MKVLNEIKIDFETLTIKRKWNCCFVNKTWTICLLNYLSRSLAYMWLWREISRAYFFYWNHCKQEGKLITFERNLSHFPYSDKTAVPRGRGNPERNVHTIFTFQNNCSNFFLNGESTWNKYPHQIKTTDKNSLWIWTKAGVWLHDTPWYQEVPWCSLFGCFIHPLL